MILKSRLHTALQRSGKRQADVARACDVSTAAVAQWFSQSAKELITLKHENLVNLADFLEVSITWLEGKTEQMQTLRPRVNSSSHSDIFRSEQINNNSGSGFVDVQSLEYWRGETEKDSRSMSVPIAWLEVEGLEADQIKTISMPDDSQSPRICRGDIVAVNIRWDGALKNDTLYVIKIAGSYTLRRVFLQAAGKVQLWCRNPDYPSQELSETDVGQLDVLGEFVRFQGVKG